MVSRRALLLGSGGALIVSAAAVAGAVATDTLDDALQGVGITPLREPDAGDARLTALALADAIALVVLAETADAPAPVIAVLTQQRDALPPGRPEAPVVGMDLVDACRTAAEARAVGASEAFSVDLAQVLASMAAGLEQCAVAVVA